MRAATITDGRIEIAERPEPEPLDDLVVVRVHGAGLNRADLMQLAGNYPAPPGSPPDIPGMEFAGVVEAVGPQARGRRGRRPGVRHRRRRRAGRVRRGAGRRSARRCPTASTSSRWAARPRRS